MRSQLAVQIKVAQIDTSVCSQAVFTLYVKMDYGL
jgi:hypothetical protein